MKIVYTFLQYLLKLIACTWRLNIEGELPKSPAVIAFWHGKMLPIWKLFSKQDAAAVISLSKDGELLAGLLKKWKYTLLRGSSSRNGSKVLADMLEMAKSNKTILITPDGPRGPRMQCKPGAIIVAQRSQHPLYFIACDINNKKIFTRSWDKFEFPCPFARVNINISDPLFINKNLTKEQINEQIDKIDKQYYL